MLPLYERKGIDGIEIKRDCEPCVACLGVVRGVGPALCFSRNFCAAVANSANVHRPQARNAPQRDESNFNPNQFSPHSLMDLQRIRACSSDLSLSFCICDNEYTVVVVATTVLSRAALGTTLGLTPARSLPTPISAICNCYGNRCNQGAYRP